MSASKTGIGCVPEEDILNADLIQCPYVPTHMIRPGTRFQRHLPRDVTVLISQSVCSRARGAHRGPWDWGLCGNQVVVLAVGAE